MTSTASSSSQSSPCWLDWNTCAVPKKLAVMVEGSVSRAARCTASTACPSATPGRRLNEIVTAGICPMWLTESGPTPGVMRATALNGTTVPPRAAT